MHYDRMARSLHWVMAVLILLALAVGAYMTDLPVSPRRLQIYSWHKWLGVTVLLLVVLRLFWRLTHQPPALPDGMRAWEKQAAHAAHWLLYGLMLAVPLAGWLMSSAKGFTVVYFGVLPLPDLVGKDKALGEVLETLHATLAYSLLAVIVLHVAAALKHHFIERDEVLARMLPHLRR